MHLPRFAGILLIKSMRPSLPSPSDCIVHLGILVALFGPAPLALGQEARFRPPDRATHRETSLGQPPAEVIKDAQYFISPDGARVAYWVGGRGLTARGPEHIMGDGVRLVLDGVPHAPYQILNPPTFSQDGRHVAYLAGTKEGMVLVVNGREHDHGVTGVKGSPVVSPDGSRVAYVSVVDKEKYALVVDGKNHSPYDGIGSVRFSDDGKRVAYAARRGEKWLVVVDQGAEGKQYPALLRESIQFSPDGEHLAYVAQLDAQKWTLVIDGKETPAAPGFLVGSPRFSPDGKKLGVMLKLAEDKKRLVINGKPVGEEFEAVSPFVYSPDGQHVSHCGARAKKWMVVRDGVAGKAYDDVGQPVFSKDGSTVVYAAKSGDAWRVVVNEVEQQPFDSVSDICVSDDGEHVAYVGKQHGHHVLVVDNEVRHQNKHGLGPIALSPDGRNVAYWWPEELGHWVLFANQRLVETYDGMLKGSRIVFDSNQQCHALAHRDGRIFRVELRFAPPYRM